MLLYLRLRQKDVLTAFQNPNQIHVGANTLLDGDTGAACGICTVTIRACSTGKASRIRQFFCARIPLWVVPCVVDLDTVQLIQTLFRMQN